MATFAYSIASGTETTWRYWTSGITSSSNNSTSGLIYQLDTGATWTYWTLGTGSSVSNNVINSNVYKPKPLTEEEIAEQKRKNDEYLRKAEQERLEREKAEVVAEELLLQFLDAMQAKQWKDKNSFVVVSETGKKYRVARGRRVEELDESGKVVGRHCIHPTGGVPMSDEALAQKMHLEVNEAEFRRVANFTPA